MSDDDLVSPGGLRVAAEALTWRFSRSGGPGGQHVNTTDSKATLTCTLERAGLPSYLLERLVHHLGPEVTVVASTSRSQWRNRQEALERLGVMLDRAAVPPRTRRPTKPSRGAREARLEDKRQASTRKARRRWRPEHD